METMPAESPLFFGMHTNAEIGFRTAQCNNLFSTLQALRPKEPSGDDDEGGAGEDGGREEEEEGAANEHRTCARTASRNSRRRGGGWRMRVGSWVATVATRRR